MRILLTFFSIMLSASVFGQVIINSMSIPDVGDELEYTIFSDYSDTLSYRASGENMEWNFDGFNAVNSQTESYRDISTSALADSFPDANMLLEFGGFESAATKTDSSLSLIGVAVEGFGGFGIELNVDLDEPFKIRKAPFEYGDIIEDNFEVVVSLSASIIPGIDSFDIGIPGTTIDSIRVTTEINKREEAIGWGTLNMLGQEKEVLQIQEINSNSTLIEVGVSLGGVRLWLNAAAFLGDMADALGGNQNTVSYKFLTASDKRSVVEFDESRIVDTLDNSILVVNGRTSADFLSDINNVQRAQVDIKITPNPSAKYIEISNSDNPNNTNVEIYTINGRKVLSVDNYKNSELIDISAIPTGSYLLHYSSQNGSAVKRLIKI